MPKLDTAVHEAGHGVVAAALGFRVYMLAFAEALGPDVRFEGPLTGASMIDFCPESASRPPIVPDTARVFREHTFADRSRSLFDVLTDDERIDIAAILAAGRVAQMRFGLHPVHAALLATGDLARESELFDLMKEGTRRHHEELALRRAERIVARQWGAVCYVALALVAHGGRLEGAALDRKLSLATREAGGSFQGNGGPTMRAATASRESL